MDISELTAYALSFISKLKTIYHSPMQGLFISNMATLASSYLSFKHPILSKVIHFLVSFYMKNTTLLQQSYNAEQLGHIEQELLKIEKMINAKSSDALAMTPTVA